jgi:tellurite methyltransferase
VLDLGCGVGRHALAYARLGLDVTAIDMAESGLSELRRASREEDLAIATQTAAMTELPFETGSFDHVLSFNVIYHGDPLIVRAAITEIGRVLKPGGTYQGTMLSMRNVKYGKARKSRRTPLPILPSILTIPTRFTRTFTAMRQNWSNCSRSSSF